MELRDTRRPNLRADAKQAALREVTAVRAESSYSTPLRAFHPATKVFSASASARSIPAL